MFEERKVGDRKSFKLPSRDPKAHPPNRNCQFSQPLARDMKSHPSPASLRTEADVVDAKDSGRRGAAAELRATSAMACCVFPGFCRVDSGFQGLRLEQAL